MPKRNGFFKTLGSAIKVITEAKAQPNKKVKLPYCLDINKQMYHKNYYMRHAPQIQLQQQVKKNSGGFIKYKRKEYIMTPVADNPYSKLFQGGKKK